MYHIPADLTVTIYTTISEQGSLGAYVISQCQQASDVLAVLLLQQDAGVAPLMRVVPLFETLDDLQRAPSTMNALFSMEPYTSKIGGNQEIMVGYSDSAKDAGSYIHSLLCTVAVRLRHYYIF